jgi:hypothetical protein
MVVSNTSSRPHYRKRGLCRAFKSLSCVFIGRTTKSFFAVRRPKRTTTNLCRSSYFTAHDKESLMCVLITDMRQRFFLSSSILAINGR